MNKNDQQFMAQKIRAQYMEKESTELDALRRLDASVTQTAQIVSLILGVIGTLILGFGMSLAMTDIAHTLGLHGNLAMVIGIVIGVVGGVIAGLAYPVYNAIVKAKRKKIALEIIRLIDELMK